MRIKLQDPVAYPRSLKWAIHDNYFQNRGQEAWQSGEVPFEITSNSRAAYQNARVVFEALRNQDNPASGPITILEVASGLGLFAIHFINAFREICTAKGADYHRRLQYLATDYSPKTVLDLSRQPCLAELKQEGLVRFGIFDALAPETLLSTEGERTNLESASICAVIANYVHCTLPLTILRKKNGGFLEKHVAIELKIDNDASLAADEGAIQALIDNPVDQDLLSRIQETASYEKIDAQIQNTDPELWAALAETVSKMEPATIVTPFGSCRHLQRIRPYLKPNAVYLISDKGYADISAMQGELACRPSIHGNCFAHSFNFPLVEAFAAKIGLAACYTRNPDYSIKTMLVLNSREIPANVAGSFHELFIDDNFNIKSGDFFAAGHDHEKQGDLEKALTLYCKALKYRQYEAKIHYRLALCHLGLKQYDQALEHCRIGAQVDFMQRFDFDFTQGRIFYRRERYGDAISSYVQSLDKFGPAKETFFNIGLCFQENQDAPSAAECYAKALELDPTYKKAANALGKIR